MATTSCAYQEINCIRNTSDAARKELNIDIGLPQTFPDVSLSESAGSHFYENGSKHGLTRNRLIYWRTYQTFLELHEISLNHNLVGNSVRYNFLNSDIVPAVTVIETRSRVIVLVATLHAVFRIVLPHPLRAVPAEYFDDESNLHTTVSIFSDVSGVDVTAVKNHHVYNRDGPGLTHRCTSHITSDDSVIFSLSTADGCILVLKMPPCGIQGIVTQHELRPTSMMKRIWTGLIPWMPAATSEAAVSDRVSDLVIVTLDNHNCVIAICHDHKLRVYSLRNFQQLAIVNVLDEFVCNGGNFTSTPTPGHLLRLTPTVGKTCPLLAIYLNFVENSQFIIVQPQWETNKIQMQLVCSLLPPFSCGLVDFLINSSHVWSLWVTVEGVTTTLFTTIDWQYYTISKCGERNWNTASVTDPLSTEPPALSPNIDPRQAFLDRIFNTNLFSSESIRKAVSIYRPAVGSSMSVPGDCFGGETLREEVIAAIEREIQNTASSYEMEETEYYQLQWDCWAQLYSRCVQYQEQGNKSLSVFLNPSSGMGGVVKIDSISFLLPAEPVSLLETGECRTFSPVDYQLHQLFDTSDDDNLLSDILQLGGCARQLRSLISDDVRAMIDQDLYHLEPPVGVAEQIVAGLVESRAHSDVIGRVRDVVRTLHDPVEVFRTLLVSLDRKSDMPSFQEIIEQCSVSQLNSLLVAQDHTSDLGLDVLSRAVAGFVQTRKNICLDLLLLQTLFISGASVEDKDGSQADEIQTNLIHQAARLLQLYFTLDYILTQPCHPVSHETFESNLNRLSSLEIVNVSNMRSMWRQDVSRWTVLDMFLRYYSKLRLHQYVIFHYMKQMTTPAVGSGGNLLFIIEVFVCELLWPFNPSMTFAECLMSVCQYLHLENYLRLVAKWCKVNSYSASFLQGMCHLHSGEVEKAFVRFSESRPGAEIEPFLMKLIDGSGSDLDAPPEISYCLKVIDLFESHRLHHLVVRSAHLGMMFDDPDSCNVAVLWSKIFKNFIELEQYEDAYHAVLSNPDPSRQKDCLRQLIVVLHDRGKVRTLCTLPFTGLTEEVIDIIETRARSIDLTVGTKCNFYDLLYAFHMSKCNFRRASSVMYELAMRLAREMSGSSALQRQGKCLLAAITALRLVDVKYAWIVQPGVSGVDASRGAVSPKRPVDDDDVSETTKNLTKMRIRVVELVEIENQHRLLAARLKIMQYTGDQSLSTGAGLSPEATVALLVQTGLYDDAVSLCERFKLKLHSVFEGLTSRCVRLMRYPAESMCYPAESMSSTDRWGWMTENNVDTTTTDMTLSALSWDLLKKYATTHTKNDSRYLRVISAKLLSQDVPLPHWLTALYKQTNAPEYMQLLINYDFLDGAIAVFHDYINALLGANKESFGLRNMLSATAPSVWIPYTIVDQLRLLVRKSDSVNLTELHGEFEARLDVYMRHVDSASQAISAS